MMTPVDTAQQLRQALDQGVRHIVVTHHLDLTTLAVSASGLLGQVSRTTESITARLPRSPHAHRRCAIGSSAK